LGVVAGIVRLQTIVSDAPSRRLQRAVDSLSRGQKQIITADQYDGFRAAFCFFGGGGKLSFLSNRFIKSGSFKNNLNSNIIYLVVSPPPALISRPMPNSHRAKKTFSHGHPSNHWDKAIAYGPSLFRFLLFGSWAYATALSLPALCLLGSGFGVVWRVPGRKGRVSRLFWICYIFGPFGLMLPPISFSGPGYPPHSIPSHPTRALALGLFCVSSVLRVFVSQLFKAPQIF